MLDIVEPASGLDRLFETVAPVLDLHGPAWLHSTRTQAIREFRSVGIPTPSDEEFRFFSLRHLQTTEFQPAYGVTLTRADLQNRSLGQVDAITVTFANGQYAPELSSDDILPDGVYVGSLEDAFDRFDDVIARRLTQIATLQGRLGSTNDERFVALNTAFLTEGAFVYVPQGVALERPIHLQFVTQPDHGPLAVFPRILVVMEANAQATVIESHGGQSGEYFTCPVTEIWLDNGANLEHNRFVSESDTATHIANIAVHQGRDSVYVNNAANFAGRVIRNDVNVWSDDEHTETSLNAANVGIGRQVIDNHTRIDHAKPNCHSFEVYKSILRDQSHGIFNGKIFVYQDAQKTDAKQTNQALLLSPDATMNTKPQLEIFADDVKCTHGATIGQLREDALFYLRARGIPKAQAEALLVYAFAAEVLERISVPDARAALESALFARLS